MTASTKKVFRLPIILTAVIVSVGIIFYFTYRIHTSKKESPSISVNSSGDRITIPGDIAEFFFPEGSFQEKVNVSAAATPGYISPKNYLVAGATARIHIIRSASTELLKPMEITMKYYENNHVDVDSIAIFYGSLTSNINPTYSEKLDSTINKDEKTITAFSNKLGVFGVLGKRKCPEDTREPTDDQYKLHGGQDIIFNDPLSSLLDSEGDRDCYFFYLEEGKEYTIEVIEKTKGVVPVIELTTDGATIVQSNKKSKESSIKVKPDLFYGYVQLKISPAENSLTGCNASYTLVVKEI